MNTKLLKNPKFNKYYTKQCKYLSVKGFNGKDWSAALILHHTSGGRYSYPSVIQAIGKTIHSIINPALLTNTVPMPDGKWPSEGPLSLKEYNP